LKRAVTAQDKKTTMTVIYRLARSRGKVVRAFGDDKFDVPLSLSREFAEGRKYVSGNAPARGGVDEHDIDGLRSRMGRRLSRLAVPGGAFLAVRHLARCFRPAAAYAESR